MVLPMLRHRKVESSVMLFTVRDFWAYLRVPVALGTLIPACNAQTPSAQPAPEAAATVELVRDAARYQQAELQHTGWALRYRVHRADSKEDTVRDLVETASGNVARTLQRGGVSLPPDQEHAELERLHSLTTAEVARHHHNGEAIDHYGSELVSAMPDAMDYRLASGQPQLPNVPGHQIVLDYDPRPGFKPSGTVQSLLTGLAGRMWIDADTHHLLRIEVHVTRNLSLALGLLARVYQGGTLTYEQRPVGEGHYAYSHIDIHVLLRELLVKTAPYQLSLDTSDVVLLPAVPTVEQAVELLLADEKTARPPAAAATH